jgi:hypothetical protein
MLHLRVCISWVGDGEQTTLAKRECRVGTEDDNRPSSSDRNDGRQVGIMLTPPGPLPSGMRLALRFQLLGLQRAWADSPGQDGLRMPSGVRIHVRRLMR